MYHQRSNTFQTRINNVSKLFRMCLKVLNTFQPVSNAFQQCLKQFRTLFKHVVALLLGSCFCLLLWLCCPGLVLAHSLGLASGGSRHRRFPCHVLFHRDYLADRRTQRLNTMSNTFQQCLTKFQTRFKYFSRKTLFMI